MTITFRPYIGAEIPPLAENLRARLAAEYDAEVAFEDIASWLSDHAAAVYKENFKLSRTHPDFESIKQQFITKLHESKAWKDIITAGGGQTVILDYFAAIGDYGQFSVKRAYDENSFDGARLKSSIYRLTRTLGVHIDRRIPAQVQVALWSRNNEAGNLGIPSLSQFSINGIPFFNRTAIAFDDNTEEDPKIAVLYQGEINTITYVSNGSPFQGFELGDNDFAIANEDVYCYTDAENEEFARIVDGPWHYTTTDKIFWENTTYNGNVEILFGNGIYGSVPVLNRNLHFVYATTIGNQANNSTLGLDVELENINTLVPDRIRRSTPQEEQEAISTLISSISGTTISPIRGGDLEKDKEFYRHVAPSIRAANKRTVTRRDHYAYGLLFPNIADIYFQGQRELGRTNRNYINLVSITGLKRDGTVLSELEWRDLKQYMLDKEIWRVEYIRIDPQAVPIDVKAIIYVTPDSDKTNVASFIRYRLNEFLKIQRGSLGRSVYRNDIEDLMKFSYGDMRVDFAQVIEPKIDYILTRTQYPILNSFDVTVEYSTRDYHIIPPKIVGSSINA